MKILFFMFIGIYIIDLIFIVKDISKLQVDLKELKEKEGKKNEMSRKI